MKAGSDTRVMSLGGQYGVKINRVARLPQLDPASHVGRQNIQSVSVLCSGHFSISRFLWEAPSPLAASITLYPSYLPNWGILRLLVKGAQ